MNKEQFFVVEMDAEMAAIRDAMLKRGKHTATLAQVTRWVRQDQRAALWARRLKIAKIYLSNLFK